MTHTFTVEPVRHYDGAKYPACPEPSLESAPLSDTGRTVRRVLKALASAACVVWVAVSLSACGSDLNHSDRGGDSRGAGDEDILLGVAPMCQPGDIVCQDSQTLVTCDANRNLVPETCQAFCERTYGVQFPLVTSLGCDVKQADPCQCQYDIIDGDVAQCTPGDVMCVDDQTVAVCNSERVLVPQACAERCSGVAATDGAAAAPVCDPSKPEDPCGCGK